MRIVIILFFLFTTLVKVNAQETKTTRAVVLLNDSIPIYANWYKANYFSDSYFICLQEFDVTYTDASFTDLVNKLKKRHQDISVFKSKDNKSITCVFPKHTLAGIENIQEFITSNFDAFLKEHLLQKKIIHIQVTKEYDANYTTKQKGFKGFN